jgi:hypothetical protein
MPVAPLVLAGDEKLAPPQPKFVIGEALSDGQNEANRLSHHSRTTSANTSFYESPPITPRSLTFNTNHNSFTALNSQAFYINDQTPGTTPAMNNNPSGYPFPDARDSNRDNTNTSAPASGVASVASVADFSSRNTSSLYGSRPGTGTGRERVWVLSSTFLCSFERGLRIAKAAPSDDVQHCPAVHYQNRT